jgi:D-methionine transport system substrate-binding protein
VADALEEESFGNIQLVDVPVADLRSTLAELETAARELTS